MVNDHIGYHGRDSASIPFLTSSEVSGAKFLLSLLFDPEATRGGTVKSNGSQNWVARRDVESRQHYLHTIRGISVFA